ncbi:MAG: DNA polymerase III subunit delta' [Caldimonas sp.]
MSAHGPADGDNASGAADDATIAIPWLIEPLRRTLTTRAAHALLVHGPGNVGQFELALALAKGWLCERSDLTLAARPCGRCPSCLLFAAHTHPDLLVLVPDAMRETLGWDKGAGEGEEGGEGGRKKPSKEIRVDAVRAAISFATTTSARGRGKFVVVHPAERMNEVAASAFLKTLEEPAGDARFLLCSAAPDRLLPTIRSRCQQLVVPIPATSVAETWLAEQGVADAGVLLAAAGGQPLDVVERAGGGLDAATWLALPGRVANGEATALHGWSLPFAVESLQKICHDALCLACGAAPRYFPRECVVSDASVRALLGWARELARVAIESEHPWAADLAIESLVEQGREALKTTRSQRREAQGLSLHSRR